MVSCYRLEASHRLHPHSRVFLGTQCMGTGPGGRIILESTQEKGNPENNKLKQEGVRLRNGMGTPGDGMSRTISVIALKGHPGQPLSPRETRTVGTQMMCHTTQCRESLFHEQSFHLALLCLITSLRPSTSLLSKRSLASDPSLLQATVVSYLLILLLSIYGK